VDALLPEVIQNVEEGGLLQVEVAIPMYLAAKLAAEDGIRVMFTGQAADELFAGYPWYSDVLKEHGYLRMHEKLWEDLNLSVHRHPGAGRQAHHGPFHRTQGPIFGPGRDHHRHAHFTPPQAGGHRGQACASGCTARPRPNWACRNYLAFRAKDPAQSGSGHSPASSRTSAQRRVGQVEKEVVERNIERDKGSLYRYGDDEYGEARARYYLQHIEDQIRSRFIPPFLAADHCAVSETA
jgi:asparagine synthase (glutamine-hydrolysing)